MAYLWRKAVDELAQNGTTFDIVLENNQFNFNDTLFNVGDVTWWKDIIPVNQNGTTNYNMTIIPHITEGNIPLYTLEKVLTLQNGQQLIGRDTVHALEQETKFVVHSRDFDNNGNHTNTRIQFYDDVGSLIYEEDATDGIITTPYVDLPFTGTIKLTPLNGSVVDNTKYGVEFEVSKTDIQTDFNKTDTVAGYLMDISQEDPYTGSFYTTNTTGYREIDDDNINASLAMFGVENVYFPAGKHADYESFKTHLNTILGYTVNENEVTNSGNVGTIEDYDPYTNNYEIDLVWTITFGNNSTNPKPITPLIFGKSDITSRGSNGYDIEAPDGWAGCVREYLRRLGAGTVYSRQSVMSPSLPHAYPQNLSVEDRVYFSDFPKWQETKLYKNLDERNQATWDDLFVPNKNSLNDY